MTELATRLADQPDELLQRLLRQLARELLLLESSDWQFLISTWSARDYAELRVGVHNAAFKRLAAAIEHYATNGNLPATDRAYLEELEEQDALFPDVDPKQWVKSNA
jgi:1,4-alpha-glucan branching enzyme